MIWCKKFLIIFEIMATFISKPLVSLTAQLIADKFSLGGSNTIEFNFGLWEDKEFMDEVIRILKQKHKDDLHIWDLCYTGPGADASPNSAAYRISLRSRPASETGNDLYDLHELFKEYRKN